MVAVFFIKKQKQRKTRINILVFIYKTRPLNGRGRPAKRILKKSHYLHMTDE